MLGSQDKATLIRTLHESIYKLKSGNSSGIAIIVLNSEGAATYAWGVDSHVNKLNLVSCLRDAAGYIAIAKETH